MSSAGQGAEDVQALPDALVADAGECGVPGGVTGLHRGEPQRVRLAVEYPVPGVEDDPAGPRGECRAVRSE